MQNRPTEKMTNTVAAAAASHLVRGILEESALSGFLAVGESSGAEMPHSSSRRSVAILSGAMETGEGTSRSNAARRRDRSK